MRMPASLRQITVLSGGAGGARFVRGLRHGVVAGTLPGVPRDAEVTVVANTADDWWVHGLKVCPDLDTVMYTLGNGIDPDRGWGRRDETWHLNEELAAYGVDRTWFGLGDRDLATHLVRTEMLEAGFPLSQVTQALCRRWLAPLHGDGLRLLPMSDDRVETHIAITDPESPSGRRVVHFQEYWVRLRAEVAAEAVLVVGQDDATPAPGVVEAITKADLVVVPPSNPVVSVGTILGVPGVREAVVATTAPVVGLSPIVGGHHVRGMAEQVLAAIGVEASAGAVGRHYGARSEGGVLDGWLVDEQDVDALTGLGEAGLAAAAVPLMMTDDDATAAMAAAAMASARSGRATTSLPCWPDWSSSTTGTSCWSRARRWRRPRAGSCRGLGTTSCPTRPPGSSPAGGPPRSCGPTPG
jgi:LPPG:FO 2-phospho-L-lactate transferase